MRSRYVCPACDYRTKGKLLVYERKKRLLCPKCGGEMKAEDEKET